MPTEALTVQLLQWIGDRPRGYGETMEAWRTSCPRLSIFEDAMSAGLIERVPGGRVSDAAVGVTAAGQQFLRAQTRSPGSGQTQEQAWPAGTSAEALHD